MISAHIYSILTKKTFFFEGFFEKMSNEAELDPDVPVMMKNSLYARKSIVKKAKTMKFESLKRSRSRSLY